MYAGEQDGLGVAWFIPVLIAAASSGASAVANRALAPKPQQQSQSLTEAANAEKQKQTLIYIATGGVLLVFILASMRR